MKLFQGAKRIQHLENSLKQLYLWVNFFHREFPEWQNGSREKVIITLFYSVMKEDLLKNIRILVLMKHIYLGIIGI